MRLELALIVGIIFFCCWCAYIILKMNSSVPNLSQQQQQQYQQYPPLSELTTTSSPLGVYNETAYYQNAQFANSQQVPQYYQQQQQPSPSFPNSNTQYQASQTNRQPQFAAPYATQVQVPWSPQNSRPLIQQQQQQQPIMRYQARRPPVDSSVNYFAAPSIGSQYAQTMNDHLNLSTNQDRDPDEQAAGEAEAETEAEGEEQPEESGDPNPEQSQGGEEVDETGDQEEPDQQPVNSELEEHTGRRSFSEDESDLNERDRNGMLVKEKHRHFVNGKPVSRQRREQRRRQQQQQEADSDENNLAREIDFDKLVDEIDASNGANGDDNEDETSGQKEDSAASEQQQPEGSENLQRRSDVMSLQSASAKDQAAKSLARGDAERRRRRRGKTGAQPRGKQQIATAARRPKNDTKTKDSHKHELRESLTAQQWDDDVTGTTDDAPTNGTSTPASKQEFSSEDIDRAIEEQEQAAQTTPSPESIIEFEDLDLLASGRRDSLVGRPVAPMFAPSEASERRKIGTSRPLARMLARSRRQVAAAPKGYEEDDDEHQDVNDSGDSGDRATERQVTGEPGGGSGEAAVKSTAAAASDARLRADDFRVKSSDTRAAAVQLAAPQWSASNSGGRGAPRNVSHSDDEGAAETDVDRAEDKKAPGNSITGGADESLQLRPRPPEGTQLPPPPPPPPPPISGHSSELERANQNQKQNDNTDQDRNASSPVVAHWPRAQRYDNQLNGDSYASLLTASPSGGKNLTRAGDPVRGEADMSIEVLARPPASGPSAQDAYTVTAQQQPAQSLPAPPPLYQGDPSRGMGYAVQNPMVQPASGHAPLVVLGGGGPAGMNSVPDYAAHASKIKSKKKKKKKMKKMKKSKMSESKHKAANAHAMKKKSKYKKGYIRAKEAKMKKDKLAKHKSFKGATKGKKSARGKAQRGGKKGSLYLKDKGYKKRGFKKAYQKVEAGDHKTYFDEFRDKDHSKKWKHFKDGHDYSHKKHWAGKDKKLYKHLNSDMMKHKKAKSGNWKEKKKSKYSKHFDHKKKEAKKSAKMHKMKKKKKKKKMKY